MSWFCELHVVLFVGIVLFKFDNEENDVDEDDSNKEEANEVPLLLLLLDDDNNVESLISFFSSFLRSLSSLFSFLKKVIIFLCFPNTYRRVHTRSLINNLLLFSNVNKLA